MTELVSRYLKLVGVRLNQPAAFEQSSDRKSFVFLCQDVAEVLVTAKQMHVIGTEEFVQF